MSHRQVVGFIGNAVNAPERADEYTALHCATVTPITEAPSTKTRPYLRAGEVAAVKPVMDAILDMEHETFLLRRLYGRNVAVPVSARQYPAIREQIARVVEAIERLNVALEHEEHGQTPTFDDVIEADIKAGAVAA